MNTEEETVQGKTAAAGGSAVPGMDDAAVIVKRE